eukprot:scaffold42528_cov53-Phaeocystis_antarctica.AAC.4
MLSSVPFSQEVAVSGANAAEAKPWKRPSAVDAIELGEHTGGGAVDVGPGGSNHMARGGRNHGDGVGTLTLSRQVDALFGGPGNAAAGGHVDLSHPGVVAAVLEVLELHGGATGRGELDAAADHTDGGNLVGPTR